MANALKGKIMLECSGISYGRTAKFTVDVYFENEKTIDQVQAGIDARGGRITGKGFTDVRVLRMQSRNWVAGQKFGVNSI